MHIDVHQHVWTAPLQEALSRRSSLPLIASQDGLSTVHCCGELPYVLDTESELTVNRTALLDRDGLDAAIIAISSPIGIEALAREEALELIDAHLRGVQQLGPRFGAWGPLVTDRPEPDDVDRLAELGCIGISIAAGAIATTAKLQALTPTLSRVSEVGLALFIHPGRGHGDLIAHPGLDEPLWWRALNDYVFGMQAAWLAWVSTGRREHPELTVIFAMLAGLAPLQAERLATRGGPPFDLRDPNTFYDTSSYGPDAITSVNGVVSSAQLLYGSDRPVLEPLRTGHDSGLKTNAGRLFARAFEERGVNAAPATPLAA
jgi:6-methylsalicylate decarboxylase